MKREWGQQRILLHLGLPVTADMLLLGQVRPNPLRNGALDAHRLLLATYKDCVVNSTTGHCEVQQHQHSSTPRVHRQSNINATVLNWCYVGIWNRYGNFFALWQS